MFLLGAGCAKNGTITWMSACICETVHKMVCQVVLNIFITPCFAAQALF